MPFSRIIIKALFLFVIFLNCYFYLLLLFYHRYVVLISGVDLAGSADILFPFELLIDWVSGWLGDIGEQKKQALVSRVLFAGKSSLYVI